MKKTLMALALLVLVTPAQARMDGGWAGLWRNADQRGDALLQQGNASPAAKEYSDARRKACAEFKAGNYAAAAHDLEPFKDSDAEYNRGNALAHGGDLQAALKAYDAALKADPRNQDAKKNRDLVAEQLKKNPPPPKKDGQKDNKPDDKKDGKQDDKKDGKQDGKQDGKPGDNKDGKPDDKKDGQQDGKPNDKPGEKPGEKPGDKPSDQPDGQQGGKQDGKSPDDAKSDAEQARREMAQAQKGNKPGAPGAPGDGAADDPKKPPAAAAPTEQQIAQEQWLRSIPDDPGGLLRRKFMIEHMIRQRSEKP